MKQEMSGSTLTLAFIGVVVVLFASYAGYWWLAQRMAWWTFAALGTGTYIGLTFVRELIKELRK